MTPGALTAIDDREKPEEGDVHLLRDWLPGRFPDFRTLAIFEIAFFLAYQSGMGLSSNVGAPFWFPDSVLLCALMLSPPGMWWAYIIAPLPLRLFVAVTPGLPLWFLLLAFANDSLKGLMAAYLMRRALHGREIRFNVLRDLWTYLVVAVLLAPALSGVVGATAWLALQREFWPTWQRWFLGDLLANLMFTPLLLYLAQNWRKLADAKAARYAEALVLFSALPLATHFAYKQAMGEADLIHPLGYIPLPFLVWAAVRFGPAGASGALSIMSVLAVASAGASQVGVGEHGLVDTTFSIQLIMIVLAVPIMSLSVLVEHQHRTEESLRESEERFRNMADTAPVMIWVSGSDKLRTFVNKVWLEFTGRAIEQELGEGWAKSIHPDDLDRCSATYAESFDARRRFLMEYRFRRADSEYRWLLDEGIPRFTPDGIFAGYIGSCIDITEIKRTHEQALANQKLETLGELSRGIAHDFDNLLAGILASAELALAESEEGSPPEEELLRIRSAASYGGEIVRQLMTYAGEESPAFEPIDLSLIVHEMLQLLKVSISKHAILKAEISRGLPAVRANQAQIRQVVMNLVTNASQAIGERDGTIRVTVVRVRVGQDESVTGEVNLAPGEYLKLEVSDTGTGMTPEVQAKMFNPFFTTKATGRGLGLAIVRGIVSSHLGAINVESSLGQGTRFEVLLPCTDQPVDRIPSNLA